MKYMVRYYKKTTLNVCGPITQVMSELCHLRPAEICKVQDDAAQSTWL